MHTYLSYQMLDGIRVCGKGELEGRIYKYFEEINKVPIPYHRSYKLEGFVAAMELELTANRNDLIYEGSTI